MNIRWNPQLNYIYINFGQAIVIQTPDFMYMNIYKLVKGDIILHCCMGIIINVIAIP